MSQRTRINQKFLFTTFLLFLIAGYVINADIREDAARWPEDFFSFAVIGHIYPHLTTGGAEYIIRKINADNPSLIVVTGDSIPGADTREDVRTQWDAVEKLFSSFRMPIYFVPGNHDLGSPAARAEFIRRFGSLYRIFEYNGYRFYLMNSISFSDAAMRYKIDEQQREKFFSAPISSKSFVFLHHALWLAGTQDPALNEPYSPNDWMDTVHPLLAGKNLHVFAGDGHTYKRYDRDAVAYHLDGFTKNGYNDRSVQSVKLGYLFITVHKKTGTITVIPRRFVVPVNENRASLEQ